MRPQSHLHATLKPSGNARRRHFACAFRRPAGPDWPKPSRGLVTFGRTHYPGRSTRAAPSGPRSKLTVPASTERLSTRPPCLAFGTWPGRGCPQPQHVRKGLGLGTLGQSCLIGAAAAGDSRAYSSSKVIHRWRGEPCFAPPQPTVNNFGGGATMRCEQFTIWLNRRVEHAGSGRRIPRSNVTTFTRRRSLRDPAPCRKGTLRTFRLQVETGQRRTSISASTRQGPRAQQN